MPTTPPKVELSETSVRFQGDPGTVLEHTLKLQTAENRPVYAHATSTAPWLRVAKISLEGRLARIRLLVPSVPEMPGQTLQGKLLVSANGNQRFTVAVSLSVCGVGRPGGAPVVVDWAAVAPPPRRDRGRRGVPR